MMNYGDQMGDQFIVRKLLISETGTYDDQYSRPYHTTLNGNVLSAIVENVSPTGKVTANNLAGIANQFIMPQAQPERKLSIAGDWGERRLRFIMIVETRSQVGVSLMHVYTGYSENFSVSHGHNIDPNMNFYINGVITMRASSYYTPLGNQSYFNVSNSSHVLANQNFGKTGIYGEQLHQMRPTDMYATMTRTQLGDLAGSSLADTRTMMKQQPVMSRRSNSSAPSYASSLFQNYRSSLDQLEAFGQNEDEILQKARGLSKEAPTQYEPFMRRLAQIQGTSGTNVFTLNDLQRIDPNALSDEVSLVAIAGSAQQRGTYEVGQAQNWQGSDRYTQVATILSHAVPALMMDLTFAQLEFFSTNRTLDGKVVTNITAANDLASMIGQSVNTSNLLEQFIALLEHTVLNDISFNNQVDFAIYMKVNILGETTIRISMNGEAEVPYTVPSFCDGIMVPVITANDSRAVEIAKDFQGIFGTLYDSTSAPLNQGDVPFGQI